MATAGIPPINRPASARVISNVTQSGAKAPAMVSSAEDTIDTPITVRRPKPSAMTAAAMMPNARDKVERDRASELSAALT